MTIEPRYRARLAAALTAAATLYGAAALAQEAVPEAVPGAVTGSTRALAPLETPLSGDALYMAEGSEARGPLGYYMLCERGPAACPAPVAPEGETLVGLTRQTLFTLDEINRLVNSLYVATTDIEAHGVADLWSLPLETADCEDFVLAKRAALIARGWPAEALLIGVTIGRESPYHAVLIARTSAGEMVLDNLTDEVLPWRQSGYEWVVRQSSADPRRWVRIEGASEGARGRIAQAQ